ncbi:hypothetical protein [Stackebrandtia nassauensis]|uniref:DUF4878 domain-containing protein n=1 Tax=Stackebrandtia nassauensis (strain DSM 44728 / CIP 108903 / NRRL B-16338 / NBRC 102104 / LLR-40K-21) TaxID=446470 RepID=D3Q1Z6_STANL|nr:hypothetical protein [Stackebrandtia nassauensis]ADD41863.1 hypothetical protein Snas_2171 [Stackebrandtia nassauensis DSM 44728]
MTQPFQYDPSQQPGQPSAPFDPAQQGQPAAPFDQPPQQPPYDPGAQQPSPLTFEPGQAAAQPFGPSSEPPVFLPPQADFLPDGPKKSRGGLYVVLAIVVVLLIGGGIGVAIWRPWAPATGTTDKADSSEDAKDEGKDEGKDDDKKGEESDSDKGVPSQVVDDAWHAKDWDQAKSYMCEKLVTKLEKNGAADKYKPIGADEEFKTTDEKIDGEKATVSVETSAKSSSGKTELASFKVNLVKEESDWKICEISEPK